MTAQAEFRTSFKPNHKNPILDYFELLWRHAKYPVTWYPEERKHTFLLTFGDEPAVDSEVSDWKSVGTKTNSAGTRRNRRPKPTRIYRITIPHAWDESVRARGYALVQGNIILECAEQPYDPRYPATRKRFAVKFIRRAKTSVTLGQGTLYDDGGILTMAESRDYS